MYKFIQNFITFLGIGILIALVFIFLITHIIRKNASFKIPSNIDKIIVGHSHPECAFDDSLISDFANFAKSGETYFYTYFKIKKLLEQNQQIKTVFIEFTNNQISEDMDGWIWGDIYMSNRHPIYAPFMSVKDEQLLFVKNPRIFLTDFGLLVKENILKRMGDWDYSKKIGGYLHLDRDKTESILAGLDSNKKTDDFNRKASNYNIYYLEKIIEYCKETGVKVYLIRSPLHPKYQGYGNERQFQQILKTKFAKVEFLDFKDVPLNNSEFGDLEHLNYHGAERFSFFFNNLLEKGMLETDNKQKFINYEMANSFTRSDY